MPTAKEQMSDTAQKELQQQLYELVNAAYIALGAATKFAEDNKLSFSFDVSYGMGGTFQGDPEERNRYHRNSYNGWFPSSESC